MLAASNSFLLSSDSIADRVHSLLELPVPAFELGAENWQRKSSLMELLPNQDSQDSQATPLASGRTELSSEDLHQYAKAIHNNNSTIVALENFNPRPHGLPKNRRAYKVLDLGSKDEAQRKAAVKATEDSILAAHNIEAASLILHNSHVDLGRIGESVTEGWQQGQIHDPNHQRLVRLAMDSRLRQIDSILDAWKKSLDRLLDTASDQKIQLVLRSPVAPWDFPMKSDILHLLKEFSGSPLRVYYDCARIHCHESLAMESSFEWRDQLSEAIIGFHINDSIDFTLGHLPSKGSVPFETCFGEAKQDMLYCLRVRAPQTQEDMLAAIAYLRSIGLDGPPATPWEDSLPIIGG